MSREEWDKIMTRHFHAELNELKTKLTQMGAKVELAIYKATQALLERSSCLAEEVFPLEQQINQLEIEIDDQGHSLMAIGQPVATDLRLITAILKINTDLERLGDHAVNIAERTIILSGEPPIETNLHLPEMVNACRLMLKDAINAFVMGDVKLAQNILRRDDEVDTYNDELYLKVQSLMEKDPLIVKTGMKLVRISHDLERIADLANNIAEDVVYVQQGKDVRHQSL